jgi:hypothetical protein
MEAREDHAVKYLEDRLKEGFEGVDTEIHQLRTDIRELREDLNGFKNTMILAQGGFAAAVIAAFAAFG